MCEKCDGTEFPTIQVLIAEDELLVRLGLAMSVPWEQLNMRVVAEVSSGEAALAAWKTYRPDIVITDLIMPGINGLDLLKEIRARDDHCAFIVVTCVNRPEIWSSLQQLAISSYLLKATMTREDILDAVVRARDWLAEHMDANQARQKEEFVPDRRDVEDVLLGYGKAEDAQRALLKLKELRVASAVFVHILGDQSPTHSLAKSAMEIVRDALSEISQPVRVSGRDEGQLLLWDRPQEDVWIKMERRMEELADFVKKSLSLSLTFVFAPHLERQGDLTRSIGTMHNIFPPEGEICTHMTASARPGMERFEALCRHFEAAICARLDCDVVYRAMSAFWEFQSAFFVSRRAALKAAEGLAKRLASLQPAKQFALLNRLAQADNTDAFCDALESLAKGGAEMRPEIQSLISRMARDPSEELSLEKAAQIVNLHPIYLSTLFHKQTGVRFSNYLNGMRVAKAKELLSESNLAIVDIAIAVGFQDISYFSKVFRSQVGMSPSVWRRQR